MTLRLENERFEIILASQSLPFCEDTFINALDNVGKNEVEFEVWIKNINKIATMMPVARVSGSIRGQHYIVETTHGPKRFIYQAYKEMMDYCATA